jgi:hypothetical protein
MFRHGPSCLEGPVSRSRPWWAQPAAAEREPEGPSRRRQEDASGEMRLDLIESVRAAIAAGVYDTPDRWEQALDRLFERLSQSRVV